jgi:hypothetical protein
MYLRDNTPLTFYLIHSTYPVGGVQRYKFEGNNILFLFCFVWGGNIIIAFMFKILKLTVGQV